jgi:restriction endonuclease S subunit
MNSPDLGLRVNPDWAKLPLFDRKGWRSMKFGDFADSINERVEPADAADEPYVGLDDLDPGDLHIRRWGKGSDVIGTKLRFRKGDIIFGRRRAYQRKLAVGEFDGICSAHAMVVRAKPKLVLPEFLPFLMMSDRFMKRAVEISVGSLSPTINWTTLKLEEFDLPPLDQQRRLATLLWSLDEQSQRWMCLRANLELAIGAVAEESFRDGEHAARVPAREACELITVGIVVKPASYYTDAKQGVRAIRSLNVLPGRFDLSDLVYLTKEGHKKHSRSELRRDDVLIVRTGRPGDAALVTDDIAGSNLIDLILVRPRPALRPDYLVEYLNSAYGRRQIFKGIAGTAQLHFNVSQFENLSIPVPNLAEQRQAVSSIANWRQRAKPCSDHINELATIRAKFVENAIG